jgi:RecA-family ATPase
MAMVESVAQSAQQPACLEPFEIEPASLWAERDPPAPRDWIHEGLAIAAARVSTFMANGGFGKTTIAIQLGVATALSRPLFGKPVAGGPVAGFFCEDEQAELERRVRAVCDAEKIDLASLDQLHVLSRDGADNVLCTFDHDQIVLSDHYWRMDATLAQIKPRLTILDTAADSFAGDFMSTPQVRQFIKVALGGFCVRHGTAVLLVAHPSSSAMASGDGGGFSTAWNNSVRSRLYLRRPKSEDPEAIADRRVLEIKKSNYGPVGGAIPLIYERGRFVLDPEPIEEGKAIRAPKSNTRLAMAVLTYFRTYAASGEVVAFGALFEALRVRLASQDAEALVADRVLIPSPVGLARRGGARG